MSARTTTFRGHVASWELDANDHWNTMFYLRAFQQAADRAAVNFSFPERQVPARVRHVRFFKELRAAESFTIETVPSPGDMLPYRLAHIMRNTETDEICASALDIVEIPADNAAALLDELAGLKPRGVPVGEIAAVDTNDMLHRERAVITCLGIARPDDFNHLGVFLTNSVHARIGEGTAHLWRHVGLTRHEFFEARLGRAIVELKINRYHDPKAGDPLRLVSWFEKLGEKSFQTRHQLENLSTGLPVASVHTASVVFDMNARCAMAIPAHVQAAIAQLTKDAAYS